MSDGGEVEGRKRIPLITNRKEGESERLVATETKNGGRNLPLCERGLLETLSEVSICEDGRINNYGEGGDLDKKGREVVCSRGTEEWKQLEQLPVGPNNS